MVKVAVRDQGEKVNHLSQVVWDWLNITEFPSPCNEH